MWMFYEIEDTTGACKVSNREVVIPNGLFGTGPEKILKVDNLVSPEEIDKIISIVDDPEIWNHQSKNTTWRNRIADGNVLLRMYPDILETISNVQSRLSDKISDFYNVKLAKPDRSIVRWFSGSFQFPHADNTHYPNYHIGSIIYLNSNYEGGELFFPQHEITLKPVSGQAFAFPGDSYYLHGVKEITYGVRYTIPTFWKVLSHE